MKETPMNSKLARLLLLLSLAAALAGVGLNAASLVLPWWQQVTLNGTAAGTTDRSPHPYYSRSRGVFLTCLSDASAPVLQLDNYKQHVRFTACLEVDLGQLGTEKPEYVGTGGAGLQLVLLRRWQLGLQLAAGLALLLSLLVCTCAVAAGQFAVVLAAGAACCLSAGLQSAANLVFSSLTTMELQPQWADVPLLQVAWLLQLRNASQVTVGLSFFFACGAAGAALLAAVLHMALGARLLTWRRDGAAAAADDSRADGYRRNSNSHSYVSAEPSNASIGRLPRTPVAYPQLY